MEALKWKGRNVWSLDTSTNPSFQRNFLHYTFEFLPVSGLGNKGVGGGGDVLYLSKFSNKVASNYRSKIPYLQL